METKKIEIIVKFYARNMYYVKIFFRHFHDLVLSYLADLHEINVKMIAN